MMIRKRVVIFLIAVVAATICFWIFKKSEITPSPVSKSSPAPKSPPLAPSQIALLPPNVEELAQVSPNPMAAAIGSPNLAPDKEIALVLELFQIYRREFGSFPTGESNAQFLNALRGKNPDKLPIFPLTHPRLDPKGNLRDRWGQPYIFHSISRDRLEIRSKGPDQEIFTADDLVAPPPSK